MSSKTRSVCVLLAALAVLATTAVRTRTMEGSDWNVGDVFVGLGSAEAYGAIESWDDTGGYTLWDNPATPANDLTLFGLLGTYRVVGPSGRVIEDVHMPINSITTGCAVDPRTGNLFGTTYDYVTVDAMSGIHGAAGHAPLSSTNVRGALGTPPGAATVESVAFDRAGNYYTGIPDEDVDMDFDNGVLRYDGFGSLVKFNHAGTKLAEYRIPVNLLPPGYVPAATDNGSRGVDWIDVSGDGTTLFYTSEDRFVRTYNLETRTPGPGNPLTINGTSYPATPGVWGYVDDHDSRALAIRLLPPGDGSGGAIVAGPFGLYRLDAQGALVAFMSAPDTHRFFAVNISPDAQYVWTGTQINPALFKFHLATGRLMPLGTSDRVAMPAPITGLCVKLEYTAQSVDCTATPGSPLCRRLEVCSPLSPGDDDGDGLADAADPDCGDPVNNRPKIALTDRTDTALTPVTLQLPSADMDGDPLTYTFSALPAGLSYNPATWTISGTLAEPGATATTAITVTATDGVNAAPATATFNWTVVTAITNRPPLCTAAAADPATLWPPDHRMVPVRITGVTDPDSGDAIAIHVTSITQNEPTNAPGDGNTVIDGVMAGASASVRAERAGSKSARLYRIGFSATDGRATCSGTVVTTVAHDQSSPAAPLATTWYDSTVAAAVAHRQR